MGVNPAIDDFKDLAVELRAKAEQTAWERGRNLVAATSPVRQQLSRSRQEVVRGGTPRLGPRAAYRGST